MSMIFSSEKPESNRERPTTNDGLSLRVRIQRGLRRGGIGSLSFWAAVSGGGALTA